MLTQSKQQGCCFNTTGAQSRWCTLSKQMEQTISCPMEKKYAKNAQMVSLCGTRFNRGQWSGICFSVQTCWRTRLVSLTGTSGFQPKKTKTRRSIQTVLLARFCPYRPWQQQEYEYFNSRRAVWFFPRRWRLRWHITGKLLNSTSGKLDQRVRDNSIKCSCWEDQAFWCCPSPLSSNCKAVTLPEIYNDKTDSCWLGTWHWGESGPGAHTHPSAPVSSQWQDSGAKDWHGGWGGSWGNLMSHSAELSAPPPLQYENITVMKILLIAVAFPLDKLQRFLCHSVVWRA